jgi:hypothetical protein
VGLNGAYGNAEFRANLLVEPPGNHQSEDLELAWCSLASRARLSTTSTLCRQ